MKNYKKKIYMFLFVCLVLVIVSFGFLFNNFQKQSKLQNEILKIELNLNQADSLTYNLLQIESDKQAFQLTGDFECLDDIYLLKENSKRNIVKLKGNVIEENDKNIILELDSLLKLRLTNLDSGIQVFATHGFDASVAFMQLGDKKATREMFAEKLRLFRNQLFQSLNYNTTALIKRNNNNKLDLLILLAMIIAGMFIAAGSIKRSQQKIIKDHKRFQEAQQIAKMGSWEWDIASNKVTWSKAQFHLFGEDPKTYKITHEGYLSHLSENDKFLRSELIIKALEGKKKYEIEHEIIRKDGSKIIVFEQGTVLFDEKGKPTGMFGTTQDISERRIAEEKIKSEQELLRTLIDNIPDTVYAKDSSLRKILANKSDMFFMGVKTEEEFMGKTDFELFPNEIGGGAGHKNDLLLIESGQMVINNEEVFTDPNGVQRYLLSTKIPMYNGDGSFKGILGIGRDITHLKIIENELKESQKKFQSIFENAADGIYQSTVDGRFIMANPAVARIFGFDSPEELITTVTNIGEQHYADPDDRVRMAELLSLYDHIENYEVPLLTKNKTIVWVSESTRIVRDENGEIKYFEGTLKDITERKRAEEELSLVQKKYKEIFNNTADGIYHSTIEGKFVMANPSMAKIFGYDSPEDLIRSVTDIGTQVYANPEDRKKMATLLMDHGEVENFELQVLTKSKDIIWVSSNIRVVRDEDGELDYFEGVLENITLRKKAEEQLLYLSNRLQLAIQATSIGIWDWDIINNHTIWDDEMFRLYNANRRDKTPITKIWEAAIHPDDFDRINGEIQAALNGEKGYETEFRIIRKDNSVHYVKGSAVVLRDEAGNPIRMIGTNKDITISKEAEEEILQLNKSLDQFANITAHDLQEPIRMVSGFLGLLEKKYSNAIDEQGKSYIDRAKDGADRMSILIKDLLEFSRSGNKAAKKEPVDMAVVMDLVKKDLSIVVSDTNSIINIPESLPVVTGTQSALYRLFLNLISNGIKFRKKDTSPEVTLNVEEFPEFWSFTLQDNGIGVAEKDQPKLFQAFQRLHRRDEYPGTGLGLVTCKKIVETHGGKIGMTSEVGKGTAFHFTLSKAS